MCLLLFFSDLSTAAVERSNSRAEGGDDSAGRYERQLQSADAMVGDPPSIPFLSFTLLLFGTGFWFANVMGDSIVA